MAIFRYNNVKWAIPFLFNTSNFILKLYSLSGEFNIDLPIKYNYGYIRNKWNGQEPGVDKSPENVLFLKGSKKFGYIPVINFSNYHIDETMLKDSFCNELLDYGTELDACFNVSSDLLYNYIKSRYPNAKLISSEIKALYEMEKGKETEYYKKLYDSYELITLSPTYVKNGFINDIEKYSDISKFEVIVNHTCLASCDKFKEHNEAIENFEMNNNKYVDFHEFCPKKQLQLKDGFSETLVLSKLELDNLANAGIEHMKIFGYYFQPLLFPDILSTYLFDNHSEFQYIADKIDRAIYNENI